MAKRVRTRKGGTGGRPTATHCVPCRVDTTTASTTGGSTVQVLPSHKSRHTFSPPAATCQSRARLKREAVVREAARFRLRRAPESATNSEAGAPLLGASMAAASSGWAEVLGAASTQDLGARLAPRPPPSAGMPSMSLAQLASAGTRVEEFTQIYALAEHA